MKLEDLFTPAELALIDAGEYRPGRAVLDAKLNLYAALVIANNPPQSSMAWQEGYAAGAAIEREACAQLADEHAPYWAGYKIANAIRARGEK